jgi:hypothetical protein
LIDTGYQHNVTKPSLCWESGTEDDDGMGRTCILMEGHQGPHEFTRDDEIMITFTGDKSK